MFTRAAVRPPLPVLIAIIAATAVRGTLLVAAPGMALSGAAVWPAVRGGTG